MNPYQVMGIIASGTIVFAGVVTWLTMQGVHILLAFLLVYLVAVLFMLGMQRRARESYDARDDCEDGYRGEYRAPRQEREYLASRIRAKDFQVSARSGTERVKELRV
jgi:hypothetical protein